MISIKNLHFHYPASRREVFEDFSLELNAGNVVGLLGKNGTGKSTLLYLIAGLLRPQKGEILCHLGEQGTQLGAADTLSEMFIVPEEYDLPDMSLDAYVRLMQGFYPRFNREVLNRCLDGFEMPREMNLRRLSMGQKKKAYMCLAIAAGTRLLLMDEPTNGMDIPSKSQFRQIVAECMTDDRMIIISTHQVHDVEQLLDHVIMLSNQGALLNSSMQDLTSRYVFEVRQPGPLTPDVIYAEPTLMGNLVMAHRRPDQAETMVSLELLFNAITKGLVR